MAAYATLQHLLPPFPYKTGCPTLRECKPAIVLQVLQVLHLHATYAMGSSMKTKRPRHLFRSRRTRKPALIDHGKCFERALTEVELERPHSETILARLLDEFSDRIKPGGVYQVVINHGPHCPRDESCRCQPSGTLLELVVKIDANPGDADLGTVALST